MQKHWFLACHPYHGGSTWDPLTRLPGLPGIRNSSRLPGIAQGAPPVFPGAPWSSPELPRAPGKPGELWGAPQVSPWLPRTPQGPLAHGVRRRIPTQELKGPRGKVFFSKAISQAGTRLSRQFLFFHFGNLFDVFAMFPQAAYFLVCDFTCLGKFAPPTGPTAIPWPHGCQWEGMK